jgi:hypothetical protein
MPEIAAELAVLLATAIVGPAYFAPFEVETPGARKVVKWSAVSAITLSLVPLVGHWATAFPVAAGIAGLIFHFRWCRRNGIDPIDATPRRRYYELRGWTWVE